MANECVPHWMPGDVLGCHASAAVTGKRFVKVTGVPVEGNPRVGPTVAGDKPLGVADRDVAIAEKVGVYSQPGIVVPVTAGAAITAGQEVQSDASARAIPLAAGKVAGMALNDQATVGSDVMVKLY
jgi:hypothetical protein